MYVFNTIRTYINDNRVRDFDLSVPVGLSYEFMDIVLDCKYNIGVTDVLMNTSGRNSVFQITLGYRFDI